MRLLRQLDELYMEYPFFGSRRMAVQLHVNRKRMQRLMRIAGIEALYPKPNLSRPAPGHQIYPYMLRSVAIERPDHVWSTDITYIPMRGGFLYLVAVMDWFSRFVLSWELSNTMETGFCLAALNAAFRYGKPEIFNSDQGSQFTSADFTGTLLGQGVLVSMDGRMPRSLRRLSALRASASWGHLTVPTSYVSGKRYLAYQHESAYLLVKGHPPTPSWALAHVIAWKVLSGERTPSHGKTTVHPIPLIEAFSKPGQIVADPSPGLARR